MTEQKKYRSVEEFFGGDELCISSYEKYRLKDKKGKPQEDSPEQTDERWCEALASVDEKPVEAKRIFLQASDHFNGVVGQGSVLYGAGNPYQISSLSNCTVSRSPLDSIHEIFKTATEQAQLTKRRCGCGMDLSELRPAGARTNNAGGSSSGAVGWANFFSDVCRTIGLDGRRGALMLTLSGKHPDVEAWALMKRDLKRVTGANASIKIYDDFMKAVEKDEEFVLQWPVESLTPLITKTVRAKELWKVICESAWLSGEPGVLFWDTITKNLPSDCYEKTISTNPCSEIGMSESSCRLITESLPHYVNRSFSKESEFDWVRFKQDTRIGMRMNDNLVSLEMLHIKKIMSVCDSDAERDLWKRYYDDAEKYRRTGLGSHGWADMFIRLGIRYDSDKAKELARKVSECFRDTAYDESMELAKLRGPFPAWDWEKEKDCEFFKRMPEELIEKMKKYGRRNVSLLTCAPTGSISILSKTSSGIEPVFRNVYKRRKKINHSDTNTRVDFTDETGDKYQEYEVVHWAAQEYMDKTGKSKNELPDYFVESDKVDWKKKIDLVGVVQANIDHGISQTLNLPKSATVETVSELYFHAWKTGLKGFTVYRDGSRSGVLLTKDRPDKIIRHEAPKRPESLPCDIHHVTVQGKPWIVMVGKLDGQPYEIFAGRANKVKVPPKYTEGKIIKEKHSYLLEFSDEMRLDIIACFDNYEEQAVTRLLSMSLRHGVSLAYIVDQLDKVEDKDITMFNKAIMRVLKKYMKNEDAGLLKCKECGQGGLVMESGCYVCKNCGASKCS